jgi:hypothetical protein
MTDTKQISATIGTDVAQSVATIAQEANRSFSQMIDILLREALEARKSS